MATYNMPLYSLLIVFEDGGRKLVEVGMADMSVYLEYIEV